MARNKSSSEIGYFVNTAVIAPILQSIVSPSDNSGILTQLVLFPFSRIRQFRPVILVFHGNIFKMRAINKYVGSLFSTFPHQQGNQWYIELFYYTVAALS